MKNKLKTKESESKKSKTKKSKIKKLKFKKLKWYTDNWWSLTLLGIITTFLVIILISVFGQMDTRLDYVKIVISILGPVLTFIVFQNTLMIQKGNESRTRFQNANEDFKYLFGLFIEKQKQLTECIKLHPDWTETVYFEKTDIDLGDYFRSLSILIDIMNEHLDQKDISEKQYERFVLILRTQITLMEFKIVLYASLFKERSLGLAIGLTGSGFFGKKETLQKRNEYYGYSEYGKVIDVFLFSEENRKYRTQLEKIRDETVNKKFISIYKSVNSKVGDK